MRKEKSRSPPKLSNGRFLLILACLPTTCKNTDSQGCVSIDFTLYYLGDCWYFPNRQNKKSQLKNLSKIERNEVKQYGNEICRVVQIHPVFEELLHAFDTRPPVQRNEVE